MRSVAAAATLAAALTCSLFGCDAHAQGSAATRRTTTGTQRRTSSGGTTAAPQAGLAAVGSMPAAVGPVKVLYSMRYVDLKIGTV